MFGLSWPKESPAARPGLRAGLSLQEMEDRAVPAVIAVNDSYNVSSGRVLTVPVTEGVLQNDFSTTDFGAVLTTAQIGKVQFVGSARPLPANSLTLNPNGSFTFIAPSQIPAGVSKVTFQYQATNITQTSGPEAPGNAVVTINIGGADQAQFLAVGSDAGVAPLVKVYEVGTGILRYTLNPYDPSFTGGVRVATGDVTGDGIDDIAVAPGMGGSARVLVFSGADGSVAFDQVFFDPAFRGGAYVAIGDTNGDGQGEVIVGAGEGGGPRVTAVQPNVAGVGANLVVTDFFAYESAVRFGVRVAAGDLDGVGRDYIVTSPGAGGGPRVNSFDANQTTFNTNAVPVRTFFAFDSSNRAGVFVATGDLSGDGKFDIVTSLASGDAVVRVFDGQNSGLLRQFTVPAEEVPTGGGVGDFGNSTGFSGSLLSPTTTPASLVGNTSAQFPGGSQGGARVSTVDWNGDGLADIITGAGPGNVARVRVFNTTDNAELTTILAFQGSFLGGVFVGS